MASTDTTDEQGPSPLPLNYQIPIIPASELSYTRALNEFFIPNLPFIITGATDHWPAQENWISSISTSPSTTTTTATLTSTSTLSNDDLKGGDTPLSSTQIGSENGEKEEGMKDKKIPNWDYLSQYYGDFNVGVLHCAIPHSSASSSTTTTTNSPLQSQEESQIQKGDEEGEEEGEEEYGSGDIEEMKFNDVIQLWKDGKGKGIYIKDWHLPLQLRERQRGERNRVKEEEEEESKGNQRGEQEESFYITPDIFQNDWMNNYYTNNTKDDFSFVYFGTKGTFTPLHRDVYTSYSWSANILGRKSWTFIPPSSIPYCRLDPSNPHSSTLHSDIRPGRVNKIQYPKFSKAQVINIIQEEGSIIYVPSNWFHCVENLDDFVISINRNWGNEINLVKMFESMLEAVKETEEALSDVKEVLERRRKMQIQHQKQERGQEIGQEQEEGEEEILDVEMEWNKVVQDVLQQNVGWGWETFYDMIRYNLLHPPCPSTLSPPRTHLKHALRKVFARHEEESKDRTRARTYDGALEVAMRIVNEKVE